MDDMFGHVPQAGELPIAEAADPVPRYAGPPVHTRETMRAQVQGLLAELASADTMPWTPRNLHGHRGMWPFYVEWFRDGEGERYTAEFHAHLTRMGEPLINGEFNLAWSEYESVREIAAEREAAARKAA
jgi:hypothetical protein